MRILRGQWWCFRMGVFVLTGLLALSLAPGASATTQTFSFSGEIIGGDNPGFISKATATFTFVESCVGTESSFCGLRITLTSNITTSGPMPSQGEVLAGLVFEPLGTPDFRMGPPGNTPFGGMVGAKALVGNGNVIAQGELGTVTINSTSLIDVSGHWGLNPAMAMPSGFGTHYLSSIGDALVALNVTTSTLSSMQLFSTNMSSIEPSPPDGSRFAILDLNSLPNVNFPAGLLAYVQDEIIANIFYTGNLTGIDQNLTLPTFGTDGNPVPEPGSAALFGFGLLGLLGLGRKLEKARR